MKQLLVDSFGFRLYKFEALFKAFKLMLSVSLLCCAGQTTLALAPWTLWYHSSSCSSTAIGMV